MYTHSDRLVKPVHVHITCSQVKTCTSVFLFVQERVRTNDGVQAPCTGINIGIGTQMRELCGTLNVRVQCIILLYFRHFEECIMHILLYFSHFQEHMDSF